MRTAPGSVTGIPGFSSYYEAQAYQLTAVGADRHLYTRGTFSPGAWTPLGGTYKYGTGGTVIGFK